MSFSRFIENIKNTFAKDHLAKEMKIHEHGSDGFKNSQQLRLPPVNKFGGNIRSKPQSGFNQATLISNNGQLDFHLNSAGYIEKLLMEMEITVSTASVDIIPQYLIDRVELLSSEGNIISTIYGDNIYCHKIHKTLEEHNRTKAIENLDSSYDALTVAVGSKRLLFHIPCFIDQCQLKLSAIKSKLICRIYFSANGVTSGSAANISVSLCDLIQSGHQLSGELEALENKKKSNGIYNFRFLNPVRVASQTIAMVASNQYDVRLTSANNLSAYLLFVIRAAPVNSTNINDFIPVDYYELLDSDNIVQGIKTSAEMSKHNSLSFQGDILNYKNIYVVPFALSIDSAHSGAQTGFYSFTSNEILRIYTRSDLVSGSYRIDVYSFDYNKLQLKDGNLLVSK